MCSTKGWERHWSRTKPARKRDSTHQGTGVGLAGSVLGVKGDFFMGLAQYSIVAEGGEWACYTTGISRTDTPRRRVRLKLLSPPLRLLSANAMKSISASLIAPLETRQ